MQIVGKLTLVFFVNEDCNELAAYNIQSNFAESWLSCKYNAISLPEILFGIKLLLFF